MRTFTVIVVGMGRFGSEVARQLYKQGCEVIAMDVSSDLIQQISGDVTHAVVGDGQDKAVLKALGVGSFDCAVVGIGDNLAASVLVTMNLKELGVKRVVCKAYDDTHRRVLEKLGADQVVIPEFDQAARLARSIANTNVLDYIELSEEYGIVDVPCPGSWNGKSLKELNVRAALGVNILAIRREGRIHVSPGADFAFEKGDVVVMLGDERALKKVQKL